MTENLDLHLNGTQCAAIGLFAAYWSNLETEANFTISALGHLVNKDQKMPHRFKDRMKHWRKLVRAFYTDEETQKNALALIGHIKAMHDGRNMILHGRMYGRPEKDNEKIILDTHRHLDEWRSQFREFDADLIYEGAAQIKILLGALYEFNGENLPVSPPTLPRKYP